MESRLRKVKDIRDALAELATDKYIGTMAVDKQGYHVFFLVPLEGEIVQITVSLKGSRMEYGTWGI